jgi:hypothetical protein
MNIQNCSMSLALLLCAGSVQAGPFPPELTPETAIVKVHGDHRDCRYSRLRGWHRHVGSSDRAVDCREGSDRRADPPYPHDCRSSVEGTGDSSLSRVAAVRSAIEHWRMQVIADYGEMHADYDIARGKSQQCSRTNYNLYRCSVKGHPCEVGHETKE